MNAYDVIKRPVITEKNTFLMDQGQYTFEVDPKSTKHDVKAAVEEIFKVNVLAVNTINVPSKVKLKRRRGGRPIVGRTSSWKKAIVKLAPGQRIEIFEGV
ncbi:Ribosomal protein L25/L23 [Thermobaculum terrenum ATCC BAA-798]|uniref:Large ribosomal subunit protein uL23 n=1 Tax=Thermobaculum terrenum (strain ATCC BAA-798 / CCMEE 7001 / YNP1) TaxID=525904 RepID=D1CFC8_THET1|nr:50S ribosomal protein L23 [Thermobaculum terrenum]ACZ41634.1 Ribosomal protein L25/L23 [Thermobaculum terrenum ATCC BAA-798]